MMKKILSALLYSLIFSNTNPRTRFNTGLKPNITNAKEYEDVRATQIKSVLQMGDGLQKPESHHISIRGCRPIEPRYLLA